MRRYTIRPRKKKFPGLNDYVKSCRGGWKSGNGTIHEAEHEIIKSLHDLKPLKTPVTLYYYFFEPDRRRDKDNISGFFHKVFQDSLVKAKLLQNDGWNEIEGFSDYFKTDKNDPRIEIIILEKGDQKNELEFRH